MDEIKKRLYSQIYGCRKLKDYYYKLARKAKTQSEADKYTRWAYEQKHDENVLTMSATALFRQELNDVLAKNEKYIDECKLYEKRQYYDNGRKNKTVF